MTTYILLAASWILWQQVTFAGSDKEYWSYIDAYDHRGYCEDSAFALVSKDGHTRKKIISRTRSSVTYITPQGREATTDYRCVPEAVDPRPRN